MMNLTFDTEIVDATVALKALKYYEAGDFEKAIQTLLDVLDIEPKNWQARLMLGVCYYKTGQYIQLNEHFNLFMNKHPKPTCARREWKGCEQQKQKRKSFWLVAQLKLPHISQAIHKTHFFHGSMQSYIGTANQLEHGNLLTVASDFSLLAISGFHFDSSRRACSAALAESLCAYVNVVRRVLAPCQGMSAVAKVSRRISK